MPFGSGENWKGNAAGRPIGALNKKTEVTGWALEHGIELAKRMALGLEPGYEKQYGIRSDMTKYLLDRELGRPKVTAEVDTTHHVALSIEHLHALKELVVKALLPNVQPKSIDHRP